MKWLTGIACLVAFSLLSFTQVLHPTIGEKAPEIIMPSPSGELDSLSSLQGKMVLIDFWGSWCVPCRVENQLLKKLYRQYKDSSFIHGQGFEIFSVSMDTDSAAWHKAISDDKINWSHHVSDLQGWNSPVVDDYNFKYIPHNLLVDSNGVVVAKNLRKERLSEFLEVSLRGDN